MNTSFRVVGIGLLLVAAATGAAGKTYRWVDAQGKVHFGDQPPPAATAVITGAPNSQAANAPAPATAAMPGTLTAEECDRRRKQLESYRTASSITETDGLGKQREYSEEERGKLIARTEQALRDGCPAN